EAVSIRGLAERVAEALRPGLPIRVAREPEAGAEPVTYVPDILRARTELGLDVTVGLEEAIRRTAGWYLEGK
ncbi:MAG TPA: NAD(P)-dependent oxidoreductase, partial [Terracidiphilus sp.]|nr:NAD(P)-dependent oxidoreductase [Terracidiphilus sp.]